ncbi:D-alanyl-D-alanine carboxypeptidase/D-alanyl-D-alanine-endopeptidase [Pedobacter boryungensis]|uniref:D-alanyl-D-alanine carboxypeptidase n=1 Tax=Pedobacter boryungensis TaxID=869962 RepID=A0ABX2DBS8_9SPHI|nr:D-alanyl-D-alanine carboxypeptidase [Pedobacter boryungensis]NQX31482.1 D-alanyl-D-alanine carboxypeptidase [Pedobacter boryungensis]
MENPYLHYKKQLIYLILILTACFSACAPNKIITNKVKREFKNSAIIKQYQVGFALFDLAKKEMIFQKDADKYYTPASNTKLYTFYAGLKMMPDSIPSLKYIEKGDSLIFWGTGDPSFLHSQLKGTKAFNLLKSTNKKLFFAPGRYTGDFYGNGWQWDDYNEYYQAEINELPLMDNMVLVSSKAGSMQISPQTFASCFIKDSLDNKPFRVIRDFNLNRFNYSSTVIPAKYAQQIPYKVSQSTTVNLLSDTLNKYVGIINMKMPADAKIIYNVKSDSVFKEMLLPSDNFIAEQLLLVYANKLGEELNTAKVINYVEKQYLSALPDKPRWVDGSGLSRGNLFTPRDMVKLLELIYSEVNNQEKLFDMLPAGGKTGTLKNAYPKTDNPFVFGKTGSLSNNHNQSGYVVTKKGKVFIFSFMNNNFVLPTSDVRKEMVRVMTYIHENF